MAGFIGNVLFLGGMIALICVFPWLIAVFVVLIGLAVANK